MLCYNIHIGRDRQTQPAPRADPDSRQSVMPRRRAPGALGVSVIAHGALLVAALLLVRTAIPAAPPEPVVMQMEFAAPLAQAAPASEPVTPAAEEPPAPQLEQPAPPPPTPELGPAPVAAVPVPDPVSAPAPASSAIHTPVAPPPIPKPAYRAAPVPKHAPAPPSHPVTAQAAAPDATLSAPATQTPAAAPSAEAAHTAPIDGGWMRALGAWLAAHKTYPEEALERGEEGRLAVRFTMDRSGRVTAVEVVRGSGSEALDRAALTMLKDARLPPLPEAMQQPTITVTVQIRFALAP
jgi:protein TonB